MTITLDRYPIMHAGDHHEAPLAVKDLLQARFLSRLFAQKVGFAAERMALKGGMAMRVAHQSARHTKDIDLDADHDSGLTPVQTCVRRAIKEATAGGWIENVKVSEPKQTGTTARWKIQGTLPQTGTELHLTVEVSFRHSIAAHETVSVPFQDDRTEGAHIPVYKDEILLLNKIEALLSPCRDAPRDVVDLFLLFKASVSVPKQDVTDRLRGMGDVDLVKQMWQKLESMDEQRFQKEVLPNWESHADVPEWDDWMSIRLFVGERLQELLTTKDSETERESIAPAPSAQRHARHR